MIKKRATTQSKSPKSKDECTPVTFCHPVVKIAKVISFAVFLVSLSFLIFGKSNDIVYAIPTSMGLILLGIVLGLLAVRK